MKTYTVRAKRWDHGWELHVDGVGVTQSHTLATAEAMARSYITMLTGGTGFTVNIIPEIGGGLDEVASSVRDAVRRAEEARAVAAAQSRAVVRQLHDEGLSSRDISVVLGVSPQRISQLLADQPRAATA